MRKRHIVAPAPIPSLRRVRTCFRAPPIDAIRPAAEIQPRRELASLGADGGTPAASPSAACYRGLTSIIPAVPIGPRLDRRSRRGRPRVARRGRTEARPVAGSRARGRKACAFVIFVAHSCRSTPDAPLARSSRAATTANARTLQSADSRLSGSRRNCDRLGGMNRTKRPQRHGIGGVPSKGRRPIVAGAFARQWEIPDGR
jgi:hypothetical protein